VRTVSTAGFQQFCGPLSGFGVERRDGRLRVVGVVVAAVLGAAVDQELQVQTDVVVGLAQRDAGRWEMRIQRAGVVLEFVRLPAATGADAIGRSQSWRNPMLVERDRVFAGTQQVDLRQADAAREQLLLLLAVHVMPDATQPGRQAEKFQHGDDSMTGLGINDLDGALGDVFAEHPASMTTDHRDRLRSQQPYRLCRIRGVQEHGCPE
jgi:hypothetical protein